MPRWETRIALVRSFPDGQRALGADGLIVRGYTGQATETFDPNWSVATSANIFAVLRSGVGTEPPAQRLRSRDV